jgi:hypothetical protein
MRTYQYVPSLDCVELRRTDHVNVRKPRLLVFGEETPIDEDFEKE